MFKNSPHRLSAPASFMFVAFVCWLYLFIEDPAMREESFGMLMITSFMWHGGAAMMGLLVDVTWVGVASAAEWCYHKASAR